MNLRKRSGYSATRREKKIPFKEMENRGYPDHELEDARTRGVPFCRSICRERIPVEREYRFPKITGKGYDTCLILLTVSGVFGAGKSSTTRTSGESALSHFSMMAYNSSFFTGLLR